MGWKTFNDRIALFILFIIPALWFLLGRKVIELPSEVVGALIMTWALVIQYYFRKAPENNTVGVGKKPDEPNK